MNWIKYDKPIREFQFNELYRAGTLIKIRGQVLLIGNLNESNGTCHCCNINDSLVIEEYCKLEIELGDIDEATKV